MRRRNLSPLMAMLIFGGIVSADDVAESVAMAEPGIGICVGAKLIYSLENKPTPQCHASTIVEQPGGLVAAWFAGTHEKNPDVGIRVAHFDGSEWSDSVEVADGVQDDGRRFPCWNPVLFQPDGGPLLLFYKVGPSPSQWWGMLKTSDDHGKTWSSARRLGTDPALGQPNTNLIGPVKNKPIQLADGTILCPSSSEHDGWRVHFERSRDLGKSWEVIGPIHDAASFDAIQPSILTYADGRMQVMCRSKQGVIATSWSVDNGNSWGKPASSGLPNPNSGTDAVTLSDGTQLLVYNHTTRKGDFPRGRQMLNVATSKDGKAWTPILTLEKGNGEYSYPAVIQASDGEIHITYTYQRESVKHVVLRL